MSFFVVCILLGVTVSFGWPNEVAEQMNDIFDGDFNHDSAVS
jgi:hypothetical protein